MLFSDCNATRNDAVFKTNPSEVHFDVVKARNQYDVKPLLRKYFQAEVLVPSPVPPHLIIFPVADASSALSTKLKVERMGPIANHDVDTKITEASEAPASGLALSYLAHPVSERRLKLLKRDHAEKLEDCLASFQQIYKFGVPDALVPVAAPTAVPAPFTPVPIAATLAPIAAVPVDVPVATIALGLDLEDLAKCTLPEFQAQGKPARKSLRELPPPHAAMWLSRCFHRVCSLWSHPMCSTRCDLLLRQTVR